MKFVVFAVMAALTVVSAGCCRTKCAPAAPACAPAFQPQFQPQPPHFPPPPLEK